MRDQRWVCSLDDSMGSGRGNRVVGLAGTCDGYKGAEWHWGPPEGLQRLQSVACSSEAVNAKPCARHRGFDGLQSEPQPLSNSWQYPIGMDER